MLDISDPNALKTNEGLFFFLNSSPFEAANTFSRELGIIRSFKYVTPLDVAAPIAERR